MAVVGSALFDSSPAPSTTAIAMITVSTIAAMTESFSTA